MNYFIFLICFSFQMLFSNTAAATNAAVNPVLDIETAEKLVNEIYFKTLAQGLDYFNDSQIQNLQYCVC